MIQGFDNDNSEFEIRPTISIVRIRAFNFGTFLCGRTHTSFLPFLFFSHCSSTSGKKKNLLWHKQLIFMKWGLGNDIWLQFFYFFFIFVCAINKVARAHVWNRPTQNSTPAQAEREKHVFTYGRENQHHMQWRHQSEFET